MQDIVILDRDGVINVDLMTYVTNPNEFKPIEGSLEAIALLNQNGYGVAIATNQACIEKKIISEIELEAIHQHMINLLKKVGGNIEHIAYCPHAPESLCGCRKPETGLLIEIEQVLGVNLQGKYFVGDKESDILAGISHGSIPLLIQTGGYGEKVLETENCPPSDHCFDNLLKAAEFIINSKDDCC